MTNEYATAEHFTRWEEHAKGLDAYSLKFIIKDCLEAAEAMSNHNPIREGYYKDQAYTYMDELHRRNKELPYGLRHRI